MDPSTIWPALSGACRRNSDAFRPFRSYHELDPSSRPAPSIVLPSLLEVEPALAVAQPGVAEIDLAAGDGPLDLHGAVPRVLPLDLVAGLLELHEPLRRQPEAVEPARLPFAGLGIGRQPCQRVFT